MDPNTVPHWSLILKRHSGRISDKEAALLAEWLDADEANRNAFEECMRILDLSAGYGELPPSDTDRAWSQLAARIAESESRHMPAAPLRERHLFYRRLLRYAAILIIIPMAWYLVYQSRQYQVDLRSPASEMQVAQTGNAENNLILLSDGSQAWINQRSSLMYPAIFDKDNRTVYLSGEAFFEIRKDKSRPFIVLCGDTRTEVTGTSFHLRGYDDEGEVILNVTSGSVNFSLNNSPGVELKSLRASERGHYMRGEPNLMREISDDPNFLSWHTRTLQFDNQSLHRIMPRLSEYFHLTIEMESDRIGLCRFTGRFDQPTADEVLETIARTTGLQYRVSGDTLIWYGEGCTEP